MNRTLLERVRCMLTSSGLPKPFWGEAVKTASYLINKCPTKSLNYDTPDQIWNGKETAPTETDQNISTIQTELSPTDFNTGNEDQFEVEHETEQETIEPNLETEPDHHINPLEDYYLARDKTRREIRPLAKYSEPDFITALNIHGLFETGIQFKGFVDSDLAGNCDNRKSTSAYVFTVNNTRISWKSQLQKIIALSAIEAEYIAASDAVKEGIWLKNLLDEIGFSGNDATVYSDSQSAIYITRNPVFHDRTKYIDVKFHFIREIIEKEIIKIEKISTKCNPADMGTKILPLYKFRDCLNLLNIITD
ncbi:unnamed protein product [Fraxinus pennsylvanica]|uniref:Retrovirus-related Pol polyprotein from transposon TNT 1-94 n=1 Tax=Fraxinus pennsylvanica TaxID=56036 RepID=A0AAD2E9Y4_9LAMI|nr:unnamed protein product [Fraxinus pennsylvanica]